MQLTVSGLSDAPLKFDHLFGKYVNGFRPWKHCAQCFISNNVTAIKPDMQDGVFDLEDRLFYLCGVGKSCPKISTRTSRADEQMFIWQCDLERGV